MRLQEYLAVFSMGLTGHVHDHGVALPAAGFPAGLATTSFSFCWIFNNQGSVFKVFFLQTHHQGLRHLFLECRGPSALSTPNLMVSLYLWFKGPWWALCQLKMPSRYPRLRTLMKSHRGQINSFLQKAKWKKIEEVIRPGSWQPSWATY